jgi:hypothetical protein
VAGPDRRLREQIAHREKGYASGLTINDVRV